MSSTMLGLITDDNGDGRGMREVEKERESIKDNLVIYVNYW